MDIRRVQKEQVMQKVNIDIKSLEAKVKFAPLQDVEKTANRRALISHGLDCGAFAETYGCTD